MFTKFYDISNLKGDFTGGLVAGIVALPLALAFGVQSGLGAEAGLYGAIAVGIFAAIFGGTQTQASGPTGPMTVVSAALIAAAVQQTGSIETAMPIIVLAFLLGGCFQIAFGFLNIASYVKYFPYPVISGFMSGVGLIIVILQIFPLVGLESAKSTWAVIQDLPRLFTEFNWQALILGGLTMLIYYLFPKVTKKIPSALVALVVVSLIGYFSKWQVPVIGDIPSGLPSLQISGIFSVDPKYYALIVEYAIVLAVLGAIDSLLTSVIADNMTKTKHNSNRELIGQGIGNSIAAMFGGIPGAGATKGTVVNINAGGRTKLSGTIHGLFLLIVLLGLGSLASHIPLPVLAGLLIPIAFTIIDTKGLKHLLVVTRADGIVLILVLLMTTFGSLIQAVAFGLLLASLLFMKRVGDIAEQGYEVGKLSDLDGEQPWQDEEQFFEQYKDVVLFKHLYGPLFFGFTSYFKDQIKALPEDIEAVIFRMDRVPYIDQSGVYTLEEIIFELRQKNVEVILVGLKEQPKTMLQGVKLIPNLVPEEDIFDTIDNSYNYLKNKLKNS